MTARPPSRRRQMPSRKAMQAALKRSMASIGEQIATRVFLIFAILVVALGVSMWGKAPETHAVAGIFVGIGVFAAILSLNWGK